MGKFNHLGVGIPTVTPDNTVAGSNATRPNAIPGVPAGPINPNLPGGGGYTKKNIRTLTLNLGTARTAFKVDMQGTLIWLASAIDTTGPTPVNDAIVSLQLDTQDNSFVSFLPGMWISGFPFDKFWVTNAVQANYSIELVIITDSPNDRVALP